MIGLGMLDAGPPPTPTYVSTPAVTVTVFPDSNEGHSGRLIETTGALGANIGLITLGILLLASFRCLKAQISPFWPSTMSRPWQAAERPRVPLWHICLSILVTVCATALSVAFSTVITLDELRWRDEPGGPVSAWENHYKGSIVTIVILSVNLILLTNLSFVLYRLVTVFYNHPRWKIPLLASGVVVISICCASFIGFIYNMTNEPSAPLTHRWEISITVSATITHMIYASLIGARMICLRREFYVRWRQYKREPRSPRTAAPGLLDKSDARSAVAASAFLSTSAIFVESNVMAAIIAAVYLLNFLIGGEDYKYLGLIAYGTCTAMCPLFVLHRIARGRAWTTRTLRTVRFLTREQRCGGSDSDGPPSIRPDSTYSLHSVLKKPTSFFDESKPFQVVDHQHFDVPGNGNQNCYDDSIYTMPRSLDEESRHSSLSPPIPIPQVPFQAAQKLDHKTHSQVRRGSTASEAGQHTRRRSADKASVVSSFIAFRGPGHGTDAESFA